MAMYALWGGHRHAVLLCRHMRPPHSSEPQFCPLNPSTEADGCSTWRRGHWGMEVADETWKCLKWVKVRVYLTPSKAAAYMATEGT